MACYLMKPQLTPEQVKAKENALKTLERRLAAKEVTINVNRQGAVSIVGWSEAERGGVADSCVFRALSAANSPEFRRALAAAEARAGMRVDRRLIASGYHSHDGGKTFHDGH